MQNVTLIKQAEHGRSMIEILGVLAIIGVLSVGGLASYDYASNLYQSNQIKKTIIGAKTMADVNISPSHQLEVNRFVERSLNQYKSDPNMVELSDAIDKYVITLNDVNPKVYQLVKNQEDLYGSHDIQILQPNDTSLQFIFDGHPCQAPQVWNGIECSCPNEDEYGPDCELCPPPRQWRIGANECSCPNGNVWYNDDCVECGTNDDCDTSTPICNADNTCEPCPDDKPVYNTVKKVCEPCPSGRYWNGTECSTNECEDSSDCHEKYDDTYFCSNGGNMCVSSTFTGAVCKKAAYYDFEINGVKFYLSKEVYHGGVAGWEAAINFCSTIGKQMVSVPDLNCANTFSPGNLRSCTATDKTIHQTIRQFVKTKFSNEGPYISFDAWVDNEPTSCQKACIRNADSYINAYQEGNQHYTTTTDGHLGLCRDWGPMCYGESRRQGDECVCSGGRLYQDKDCVCPADKPIWHNDSVCLECVTDADCKDPSKSHCITTDNICSACPEGSVWNTDHNACVVNVKIEKGTNQYTTEIGPHSLTQQEWLNIIFPSNISSGKFQLVGANEKANLLGAVQLGACPKWESNISLINNVIDLTSNTISNITLGKDDLENCIFDAQKYHGQHFYIEIKRPNTNTIQARITVNSHRSYANPFYTTSTVSSSTAQAIMIE